MFYAMYVIHILCSVYLIFYFLLPFMAGGAANRQTAKGLHLMNRIGQYILVLELISGGYMVMKGDYHLAWVISALLLILIMFAMTGMSSKPFKQLLAGEPSEQPIRKIRIYSLIAGVAYLILMTMMFFG
jgi:hypothetical protein